MEKLLETQESLRTNIDNFIINTAKTGKEKRTESFLQARFDLLEKYWEKFQDLHDRIISLATKEDRNEAYFKDNTFESIEIKFCEHSAVLKETLSTFKPKAQNGSTTPLITSNHFTAALPKIQIPRFGGDIREWPAFHDLFKSLIDSNPELSGTQKLYYLKTSLYGQAELIIRNTAITESNYNSAWELLCGRYQNERLLVNSNLQLLTSLPSMRFESPYELRKLYDGTMEAVAALKSLNRPVKFWDDWLVFITIQKLDPCTRKDWENSLSSDNVPPTFEALCTFLQHRLTTLEAVNASTPKKFDQMKPNTSKLVNRYTPAVKAHVTTNFGKCLQCNGKHLLLFCPSFRQKTVAQRREFATKEKLCINCLRPNHTYVNCPSSNRCKYCQQPHHSMLHYLQEVSESTAIMHTQNSPITDENSSIPTKHERSSSSKSLTALTAGIGQASPSTILLATAIVILRSSNGKKVTVRALLDQGSQATFVSASVVSNLGLHKKRVNIPIKGIGAIDAGSVKYMVQLQIGSSINSDFIIDAQALVLTKLARLSAPRKLLNANYSHLQGLELADPNFYKTSTIDVIIGADIYHSILLDGLRKGFPAAQNTTLGWVLFGPMIQEKNQAQYQQTIQGLHTYLDEDASLHLDLLIRKFWELEEAKLPTPIWSEEDLYCEQFYKETTERKKDGRYIVRLPIRPDLKDSLVFGETRQFAIRSLERMERRLDSNTVLKARYISFMKEYLTMNHMQAVGNTHKSNEVFPEFYMPHHGVLNESSSSTKLRVVFNGSSRSKNGMVLNECLLPGPKLQNDLRAIVLRWRKHEVVFAADIKMMFRQIGVHESDSNLQRIVWRESTSTPIQDFKLRTLTYGTTSAPFLAIRTLLQLAEDERVNYPQASNIILNDFYVDDILSGAENVESALSLQRDLISILNAGGFRLHKWSANCPELLESVETRENEPFLKFDMDETVKTLGLQWNPHSDNFQIKVNISDPPDVITKRNLLSDVSKLYDPLGFLAPAILIAKNMFQRLWLLKLEWDTPLPGNIVKDWLSYRRQLVLLEEIYVPRWIGLQSMHLSYELHAFSDASEMAYSAVVYFRTIHDPGNIQISLLCAKTKLAPIKKLTIPRLELMGAHLLAQLVDTIHSSIKIQNITTYCWTDSLTVLAWLHSHPSKWKTFVANRVSQILELIPSVKWHHVPSSNNPADCASRGVLPADLPRHKLWWEGPPWLKSQSSTWPKTPVISHQSSISDSEERTVMVATTVENARFQLIYEFSSLKKLLRVTAWCHRFIYNCKTIKSSRYNGSLSVHEINNALTFWIRYEQKIGFAKEYQLLSKTHPIHQSSTLIRFSPLYDPSLKLIRVGGRLQHSQLQEEAKHPFLLPKQSPLSSLIIADSHQNTMHGGIQLTISFIRQRFWIIGARDLVRRFIHRCIPCFRQRTSVQTQLMGSLPGDRVRPAKPFSFTGLDYAGPILVRYGPGRGRTAHKAYIALFVCMATKAIHLELVSDLTTDAFIAAYKRFISRRGLCRKIYSDNGTTFIGADKELKQSLFLAKSKLPDDLSSMFTNLGTDWSFIPPGAPNFGGLWEAGVKAVKHHLRRVIGTATLSFEELYTLLTQIEACLNSRPLYPLSSDPNDLEVLTPGHFLIGTSMLSLPEPSLQTDNPNRLTRWKLLTQMQESFWRRWSKDYLNNLQVRTKWKIQQPNIKSGQLVLLRDDHLPPSHWALGRVHEVHYGADNLARVVTIQTKTNILKRPISKICALPISEADDHHTESSRRAASSSRTQEF